MKVTAASGVMSMDDSDYSQSPHSNLSTPFFAPTYSVDESECSRQHAHEDDFHRGYQAAGRTQ